MLLQEASNAIGIDFYTSFNIRDTLKIGAMDVRVGYQYLNGGAGGGANRLLKIHFLMFMRIAELLSIDPSPPYDPTKAANNNQLAAFFIGKSTTYSVTAYKGPMPLKSNRRSWGQRL